MKGWEIARLVRQIDPEFPIVYMTALPQTIGRRKECPTAFDGIVDHAGPVVQPGRIL